MCTTCTAYNDPQTRKTYFIIFFKALIFVSSLEKYLIPNNQVRENGYVVDDVPKQFTKGKSLHVIYVPEKELTIPFSMRVMMSYMTIRLIPEKKTESPKRTKTKREQEWIPYCVSWEDTEGFYKDREPVETYNTDILEEYINLNIRQVERVTGRFKGFK